MGGREKEPGAMYGSMVLWDIALKNLGNMTSKDSDKISCRFWQHFRHAFKQPLPPARNNEFPKVVKQDKNLDFLFRNNSGTAYLVGG